MAWSVKYSKSSVLQRKVEFGVFDSFSSFSFVWINISNTCQFPGLHVVFFGLLFGSGQLLFVNFSELFHDVSCKGRFSCINMTDENDVDVVLFELVNIDVFVLGPISGH
jgi:hypothetical protein